MTQAVIPGDALLHEPRLAVEGQGRLVVGPDRQLHPRQPEPVIRQIQRGPHQGRAHATPGPVIVHRHADGGHVATTGTRFHHQNQGAHHLPLALGQQAVDTIPRGQLLLPLLQGGKGKLQGTGLGIRHGVKIPQGNGIFRPGAANSDGHETS
ncbi:hypothetical protein D3C77_603850 [compost metagenome]